jgi:phosphate acetyltransferase
MALLDLIYDKAKSAKKTIVLPEATEERNLRAAEKIIKEGIASIILVGAPREINAKAKELGVDISKATIREPLEGADALNFIDKLVELRKNKGMTESKAQEILKDPLYYAAMLVKLGQADGYVAGAIHATGDVLRPALQIIKTAPGCKTVSSFFIMVLPKTSPYFETCSELFFADCAVVPAPDENQLADIAVSTAQSFKSLVSSSEPRVGMLAFSTKGSAKHDDLDKVIAATDIIRKKAPDLMVDGELQADSALIAKVGELKCPESQVAGKANVLVFPDLNSGNIAYKLVQRLAGAAAVGPIVQGLDKPVNDLSRGCSVQDIVDTVAVTACQAT